MKRETLITDDTGISWGFVSTFFNLSFLPTSILTFNFCGKLSWPLFRLICQLFTAFWATPILLIISLDIFATVVFWGQNWIFLWRVLVELSVFLLISPMGNGHHLLRGFIMFLTFCFPSISFTFLSIVANVRLEEWGGGIWFGVKFVYSALHWLQHSIREAFKPLEATWYLVLGTWEQAWNIQ